MLGVYFFFACDKALPAADFDAALVRPSFNTFDAALAAEGDVSFFGADVCDSALPAAAFDADTDRAAWLRPGLHGRLRNSDA